MVTRPKQNNITTGLTGERCAPHLFADKSKDKHAKDEDSGGNEEADDSPVADGHARGQPGHTPTAPHEQEEGSEQQRLNPAPVTRPVVAHFPTAQHLAYGHLVLGLRQL
jgi:hypothetical protein